MPFAENEMPALAVHSTSINSKIKMENVQNSTPQSAHDVHYQKVVEMVHCYAEAAGLDRDTAYNIEKKNWMWRRGTVHIEVVVHRLTFENGTKRDFLRIFSPIMEVPSTSHLLGFYRRLLELNDEKLGIKFSLVPNSPKVWASFERDIKGIDFGELNTFISDFEFWADTLDDLLKTQFPNLN